MENFRTFTDQAEYIGKETLSPDFFHAGQEVESVQQIQHELLAKLAKRGTDSVAVIHDVLKRDRQRDPILITSTGVVVNGNRRLAAMREIYEEDPKGFADFSFVECAVLPADATAADVVDIEAGLQAKQETKLDYDWIGDAQLMNAMVQQHGGTAIVSKRTNRSEKEIRNTIQALAEADLYLNEWRNAPGQYNLIKEDAQQLFKDIPKRLEGKDMTLQQASRAIAWTLYDNRENLAGRVYNYNAAFGKLATDVMERVVEKLGVSTEVANDSDSDDFSVDFGDDEVGVSYDVILDQLRDPATNSEAAAAVIDAAINAVEADKGRQSAQAPLNAVRDAHAKLMAVDVSRAAQDTLGVMRRQLEAIEGLARNLMRKIDNYDKAEGQQPSDDGSST